MFLQVMFDSVGVVQKQT